MTVSFVLAVYNEEQFLPYSLPNIADDFFDEVVVVLDRCTDASEKMVNRVKDERFFLFNKSEQDWIYPCAEAKNTGCTLATGELLMMSDADVILDVDSVRRATEVLENKEIDAVVFTYRQYSLYGNILSRIKDEWQNLLWRLIRKTGFMPIRSGIYLMRKELAILPDHPSEYDPLQQTLRTRSIHTKTFHLRPKRSRETQIQRGRARGSLPQYSTLKILIMSILQLEPYRFVGFIRERKR